MNDQADRQQDDSVPAVVSGEWLASHLSDSQIRVAGVRWYLHTTGKRGRDEYAAGHIPGALHIPMDELAGRLAAMAPPTMAPPMIPPATAAPRPRCALAGVAVSEPAAIAATATKAANVFFMSWALLEMAPQVSAGFKVNSHAVFETGRLARKRTMVNSK